MPLKIQTSFRVPLLMLKIILQPIIQMTGIYVLKKADLDSFNSIPQLIFWFVLSLFSDFNFARIITHYNITSFEELINNTVFQSWIILFISTCFAIRIYTSLLIEWILLNLAFSSFCIFCMSLFMKRIHKLVTSVFNRYAHLWS
jgi:hypothetical protein